MDMFDDLRRACRALFARPTFLAAAVLTLVLGIGAVASIFTVVDAVLLKPLPFAQSERIVRVMRDQPPVSRSPVSVPMFRDWQERSGLAFEAIGGFVAGTVNLTGSGDAERLTGYSVTPGFWNVFGQPLALGRTFGADEENRNERVVVISHALWRNRFAGATDIVGRDIQLNGVAWRVVGVAGQGVQYPTDAQLWMPTFLPGDTSPRGSNSLSVIARLRDGTSLAQAASVMNGIVQWQVATFADDHHGLSASIEPLQDLATRRVREPLHMLITAAGLVLLIACANLANLMLARGQAREQELAVRRALGAGRARLLRHVLAEAALIAVLGAIGGLLLARLAVGALLALAPDLLPIYHAPVIDLRVIATIAVIALGTLLVFGLAPALRAARSDPARALHGASRSQTGSRRQVRARGVLVAAEIGLAVTLLSGASLLIDSLRRLGEVDSGVQSAQVLTAQFSVPLPAVPAGVDIETWYADLDAFLPQRLELIEERLRALPGVDSVALSERLPASGDWGWNGSFEIVGQPPVDNNLVEFRFVSADYFRTYGIPIAAGRAFDGRDGRVAAAPGEALVNQAFVDRFVSGGDAIGRQIKTFIGDPKPILGVVGDVRQAGLERAPNAEVYFPIRKVARGELALALKVRGDALGFVEPLRAAMREVAPDVPVYAIRSMDEVTGATLRLRQFNMTLMVAFAGVALLLAAIGLYGVIACSLGERRREIGLRQAIGANRSDIHRWVLRGGLRMVVPGIAAGVVGALVLGRLIAAQLYGVAATDLRVLGAVILVLALVACAACALPTLRAARVPPMEALRNE